MDQLIMLNMVAEAVAEPQGAVVARCIVAAAAAQALQKEVLGDRMPLALPVLALVLQELLVPLVAVMVEMVEHPKLRTQRLMEAPEAFQEEAEALARFTQLLLAVMAARAAKARSGSGQ